MHVSQSYADDEGFPSKYDFVMDNLRQFEEILDVHLNQHIGWFYMNGDTLQEILDESRQKKAA